MTDEWKKKETSFHNFDENPEISGKLLKIIEGDFGKQAVLLVDEKEITLGSYGVLTSKLTDDLVGKEVKIVFTEEVPSKVKGHKPYKNFDVFFKE